MSKQITNGELAEIVTGLLVGRLAAQQLDSTESYARFMRDIADVICNHCGGEVMSMPDNSCEQWMIGIEGNDSLPEDGGIWKDYDTEGKFLFCRSETTPPLLSPTPFEGLFKGVMDKDRNEKS